MKLRRTPYSFRIILKHFTIYRLFFSTIFGACALFGACEPFFGACFPRAFCNPVGKGA